MLTKSRKNRPPIAEITPRQRNFNPSLNSFKSLCWRLNPQTHEASRKGWYRAGRGIVSRARGVLSSFLSFFLFFFALVLTPRGYKEEKKAGDGGRLGDWKMPGSHSTTASNPFLTPQHQRERGREKTESTHMHTHTHTHIHTACAASIQRHQGPWRDARNGNWVAARRLITEFQGDGSGKDGSCVVTTR